MTYDRNEGNNQLLLRANYNCVIRGAGKDGSEQDVLKFTARTQINIKVGISTRSLTFTVSKVDFESISIDPVGNFFVNNKDLFLFKAQKVFRRLIGSPVFGNGFPTIARDLPRVEVRDEYIVYFDSSHFGSS